MNEGGTSSTKVTQSTWTDKPFSPPTDKPFSPPTSSSRPGAHTTSRTSTPGYPGAPPGSLLANRPRASSPAQVRSMNLDTLGTKGGISGVKEAPFGNWKPAE